MGKKCSACKDDNWKTTCERKYEYRDRCRGSKEGIKCTCVCQESVGDVLLEKVLPIASGAVAVAAGVGITILTGGLFGALLGGAYLGMGASAVANPVSKIVSGEQMNKQEFAKDILIGTGLGVATGPISFFGNGAAAATSCATKALAVRVGTGAASGAVSGVTCGIADPNCSVGSVIKSTVTGAAVGAATGGAVHASSVISGKVTNEVAKVATKIGVSGAAGAGIDIATQLVTEGEVNLNKTVANTVTGVAMGALSEATAAGTKRTNIYAEIRNEEKISQKISDPSRRQQVQNILDKTNSEYELRVPKESEIKITNFGSETLEIYTKEVNGKLHFQDCKGIGDTYPVDRRNVSNDIKNPYAGVRPKKAPVFKSKSDEKEE